jgi:hypothetical protein
MKRVLVRIAVAAVFLVIGFVIGRVFQHATTGYHYRVLDQKEYASALGPIQWSCVFESVGMPFLDPEKTIITLGNRTIYKAQRDFQEDAPYAENLRTSSNSVAWDDRDFRFHLTVEPIEKGDRNRATNRSQPVRFGTNSGQSPAGTDR